MKVVLVRHSTAQDSSEVSTDLERHLTAKGVKKFAKLMPDLVEQMTGEGIGTVEIWSSPAFRAVETAEILQETLGVEEKVIKDFIYGGSFDAFLEALGGAAEDAFVFVVGHEPILSHWTLRLTGQDVRFKKSSLVCLNVNRSDLSESTVVWEIQP
ncbi:SixA phosphatase family protein [Fundicoccus culcitae]|uniref:Histidine phosphatase family protein n=1 Tax=Fundicoccus culcitae TaxID=2969821 RepID=A0ABY5P4C4_9LACT|nr:histidine phosphatase family protein [Fundicoccus culcitae]UUX33592.1 histidine phosphatase family protein [Fundicoccus culcitae]